MREQHWLSRHCFLCVVDDSVMCWDTRDGSRAMLPGAQANALHGHVPGWPRVGSVGCDAAPEDVAADLRRKQILVRREAQGKDATPARIQEPSIALAEEYEDKTALVSWQSSANFAISVLSSLPIRAPTAHHIFRNASRQMDKFRTSASPFIEEPTSAEREEMKRVLGTFEQLRPLLWRTREPVLNEQAVLLKMLDRRGLRPRWIFGVSIRPLRLWSWLQRGNVVIDHAPEVVATFVPIAVA